MIYSADLQTVLLMLRRALKEEAALETSKNYDLYYACLDRVDILVTEKGSMVGKPEVLEILR